MDNMEKSFIDKNGEESKVIIEASNSNEVNINRNNYYRLAMGPKKKIRKKGILTSSIGPGSSGFTQIASLSIIVAIFGIVIAFILFRV